MTISKLARLLFRAASIVTTVGVLSSGQPKRIGQHYARKMVHKSMAKWMRKL